MKAITNDLCRTAYVLVSNPATWHYGRYMQAGEQVTVLRHIDANTVICGTRSGMARMHPSMIEVQP
jgi:hypothetical protein